MPREAKILELGIQGLNPFFWAEHNENDPTVEREFFSVGTGQAVADVECKYVKTLIVHGHLAMHIYEIFDKEAVVRAISSEDPFVAIGSDELQR